MFDLEFKQIKKALKAWEVIPSWLKSVISAGKQISMLRRAMGMTQAQLAKKAGTSQRAIVRLEKGEGDPQISTLKRVAENLGCELLVRFVPKTDLEVWLKEKARAKAEELVGMSSASANLEIQKPSASATQFEINRLTQEILDKKRSSLWEE